MKDCIAGADLFELFRVLGRDQPLFLKERSQSLVRLVGFDEDEISVGPVNEAARASRNHGEYSGSPLLKDVANDVRKCLDLETFERQRFPRSCM